MLCRFCANLLGIPIHILHLLPSIHCQNPNQTPLHSPIWGWWQCSDQFCAHSVIILCIYFWYILQFLPSTPPETPVQPCGSFPSEVGDSCLYPLQGVLGMLWECGENAVPILCKKFCLFCLYHWLSGSFEQCHRDLRRDWGWEPNGVKGLRGIFGGLMWKYSSVGCR